MLFLAPDWIRVFHQMPKLEFRSDAKPSTFAYPPALQEKKEKTAEKVESAILSITAKQKKKEQQKAAEKMEVVRVFR